MPPVHLHASLISFAYDPNLSSQPKDCVSHLDGSASFQWVSWDMTGEAPQKALWKTPCFWGLCVRQRVGWISHYWIINIDQMGGCQFRRLYSGSHCLQQLLTLIGMCFDRQLDRVPLWVSWMLQRTRKGLDFFELRWDLDLTVSWTNTSHQRWKFQEAIAKMMHFSEVEKTKCQMSMLASGNLW